MARQNPVVLNQKAVVDDIINPVPLGHQPGPETLARTAFPHQGEDLDFVEQPVEIGKHSNSIKDNKKRGYLPADVKKTMDLFNKPVGY
jgi:hypothetical protein